MEQTAMQHLIDELKSNLKLDISSQAKTVIEIIIERAEGKLIKERDTIEAAYDSAKNYPSPDCDGSKYYFMKYITND
jgi:hypothetical protein